METVLLLNTSFEPLLIVPWKRAMQLLFQGKVEVLEEYDREIRTVSLSYKLPAVLRLLRFIPVSQKRNIIRFSRANVFARDNNTCQYCGRKRNRAELTLDHVTPSVQGGDKTWENIVTACKQCNQKKGGRTPSEANMSLIAKPIAPKGLATYTHFQVNTAPNHWKVYLSWQMKTTSQSNLDQILSQIEESEDLLQTT